MVLQLRGGAGGGEATRAENEDALKYDRVLWDMLQNHPDEIHFLNTVFNFLQRRTGCFNGPKAEINYEILIGTLTSQQQRYLAHKASGAAAPVPVPLPAKKPSPIPTPSNLKAPPSKRGPARNAVSGSVVEDVDYEKCTEDSLEGTKKAEAALEARGMGEEAGGEEKKEKKSKDQTPVDNGGTTDRYTWTQSLREIIVEVPLPAGTTAKMLDVQILPGRLDARLKGAEGTLVDGEWEDAIFADECMWYLEDGYLVLTIAKQGEMTWWKRIIKGDAAIDIKKIEPETSNLDDLAPDLRQTVEKMMHDQRQKAAGLPTTAEKDTQEKLKSFMAMHPEMDFSKVAGMAGQGGMPGGQMGGGMPGGG